MAVMPATDTRYFKTGVITCSWDRTRAYRIQLCVYPAIYLQRHIWYRHGGLEHAEDWIRAIPYASLEEATKNMVEVADPEAALQGVQYGEGSYGS